MSDRFAAIFYVWLFKALRIIPGILRKDGSPSGRLGVFRHRLALYWYVQLLSYTEQESNRFFHTLERYRLKQLIRDAQKSTWWKERLKIHDISSSQDLSDRLPPVAKEELRNINSLSLATELPLNADTNKRVSWRVTSGTSGTPFSWAVDRNVLYVDAIAFILRTIQMYGKDPFQLLKKERCFLLFNSGSFITYPLSLSLEWNPAAADRDRRFDDILKEIQSLGDCVLYTFPSELWLFLQELERKSVRVPISLVITTGQVLDEELRAHAESYLQCPVRSLYVTKDLLHLASECPHHHSMFHINRERALFEIFDGDSKTPPGAEGEIVVTCLDYHLMPLIRYRTGDRGRILSDVVCSCGSRLPLLEFQGRDMEFIYLPDGRRIPAHTISAALIAGQNFYRIRQFQIEQESVERLKISIVLHVPSFDDSTKVAIQKKISSLLDNRLQIQVEETINFPPQVGKFRRFIPLRPTLSSRSLEDMI